MSFVYSAVSCPEALYTKTAVTLPATVHPVVEGSVEGSGFTLFTFEGAVGLSILRIKCQQSEA